MRLKLMLVALPLLLVACSSGEPPAAESESTGSPSVEASASPGGSESSAADAGTDPASPAEGEESAEASSEAQDGGETAEGEAAAGAARLEGVPSDFPESLPLPEGIDRVSSSTSTGSGASKTWALSFGLSGAQWKEPCVQYTGALTEEGFRAALEEQSSQYVSATLVNQELAVSMACEEGRMVILVGPTI